LRSGLSDFRYTELIPEIADLMSPIVDIWWDMVDLVPDNVEENAVRQTQRDGKAIDIDEGDSLGMDQQRCGKANTSGDLTPKRHSRPRNCSLAFNKCSLNDRLIIIPIS